MSDTIISKQHPAAPLITSPSDQNSRYTCICCRIKFESANLQRGHFKTEWHLYNLKRRICSLDPLDLDSFIEIEAQTPERRPDFDEYSIFSLEESNKVEKIVNDDSDDDDWEQIEGDELFEDGEYNDDEIEEILSQVIKPDNCLFCDNKSSNTKNNVNHMNLVHGFFIPEEQYLIDLEGLIEYLGFKVGAGATCLWCNKQFTTVHGVRLHMLHKDHCKILFDQEKAIEEFKEFYDYSTQEEIPMKSSNQLIISKKRPKRLSNANNRSSSLGSTTSSSFGGGSGCEGKQLIGKKNKLAMVSDSCQARCIRKFDSCRAKILLKTQMSNNHTIRDRLRQQNPK